MSYRPIRGQIIDGKTISKQILNEIAEDIKNLSLKTCTCSNTNWK